MMNYFVYILQSQKDKKYYIGQTSDLERRLSEHNRGKVYSTRNRIPFELIYSEETATRIEAIHKEKHYKSYKKTADLLRRLLPEV